MANPFLGPITLRLDYISMQKPQNQRLVYKIPHLTCTFLPIQQIKARVSGWLW